MTAEGALLLCPWARNRHTLVEQAQISPLASSLILHDPCGPPLPCTHHIRLKRHIPKPMRPSVSPRMRAAPEATSRICSTLCTRVPSRRAWYSHVFRRYRLRMWQTVESAVSSTAADGMLQTAIPERAMQGPEMSKAPGFPRPLLRNGQVRQGLGLGQGFGRSSLMLRSPPTTKPRPNMAFRFKS